MGKVFLFQMILKNNLISERESRPMAGEAAYIKKGRILSYEMTEEGLPVYVVKDDENNTYTHVEALIFGGSPHNIQNQPYTPKPLLGAIPENYEGSFVLLLFSRNLIRPIILGSSFSRLCKDALSAGNKFDADGQMLVSTQSISDSITKCGGSASSVGFDGIVLDTTTNQKSINLQVSEISHVRISQKGHLTTDHVVLASKLLDKLSELETVIEEMVTRVNILSEIGAEIEATKAASIVGYVPKITPADPPIDGWNKGSDDSYKADCVRISGKSAEDVF